MNVEPEYPSARELRRHEPLNSEPSRHRGCYAVLIAVTIIIGGGSRLPIADSLPAVYGTYAGDTFWALLLYLCLGFIFVKAPIKRLAVVTLCIAFAVEFLQLYQAPWITAVRSTFVGSVTLGHGFLWSDLLCYSVGCGLGVAGELVWQRKTPSP